jgi:hypothetical protein
MSYLVLCSACHRHVKREEHDCPFCGTALAPTVGSCALAAAFAVGAVTVGLSLSACSNDVKHVGGGDGGVSSSSSGSGGMVAAYGPAPGGWGGTPTTSSGTGAEGGMVAAYGPPPGGWGGTAGCGGCAGYGGDAPAYGPPPGGYGGN